MPNDESLDNLTKACKKLEETLTSFRLAMFGSLVLLVIGILILVFILGVGFGKKQCNFENVTATAVTFFLGFSSLISSGVDTIFALYIIAKSRICLLLTHLQGGRDKALI